MSDMDGEADFDAEMEKLAINMMADAQRSGVKLEEKVKVFNALQPYHAAREKFRDKSDPSRANGKRTFGQFKSSVKEAPQKEQ